MTTSHGSPRRRDDLRPSPPPAHQAPPGQPAPPAHAAAPAHQAPQAPPVQPAPSDPEARTEVLRAVDPAPENTPSPEPAPRHRWRPAAEDAAEVEEPARRNGMGTPALVLGLLSAATCWTGWAGVVLGLPAVVAGYLGARRAFHNLATDGASSLGGLVTGLIGLIAGAVIVWPTLFGAGNFGDGLTLDQCMAQSTTAREMHMCKSQHLTEFNQRYPNAAE